MVMYSVIRDDDVLLHYGVRGQKWGVRRWQNPDGSLTPQGYIHYGKHPEQQTPAIREQMKRFKAQQETSGVRRSGSYVSNQNAKARTPEEQAAIKRRNKIIKRAAIAAGVAAVATAGAIYLKKHPEAIASGKQKIAEFISNKKGKKFSDGELRDMGIDVADVKKTKLDVAKLDSDVKKPSKPKTAFEDSIERARKAGVKDEDILDTKEKIDNYFMGDGSSKPKKKSHEVNLTTSPDVDRSEDYTEKLKKLKDEWEKEAKDRSSLSRKGSNKLDIGAKKPSKPKTSFEDSIEMARKAGVKDEDILDTKEKIDNYFMGDGSSEPKTKTSQSISNFTLATMSVKNKRNIIDSYKQDHPNTDLTDQEILRAYAKKLQEKRGK